MHGIIFNDLTKADGERAIGLARPAGAHRIASHLRRHGYDVEVVDFYNAWSFAQLREFLERNCSKRTLFIGWSASFLRASSFTETRLIPWIRREFPHVKLLVGGCETELAGLGAVDCFIDGYAEEAVLALLGYWQRGGEAPRATPDRHGIPVINALADYPIRAGEDFAIRYEVRVAIGADETLTFETGRGCVFKCAYCSHPLIGKRKGEFARVAERIEHELRENYSRFGVTRYHLSEETANDVVDKLALLAEVRARLPFDLRLRGFARLDLLMNNPRQKELLVAAGFEGLHFGIESFHAPSGRTAGKGFRHDVRKMLEQFQVDFGGKIHTQISMIVGLPHDTRAQIESAARWLEERRPIESWVWYPLYLADSERYRVRSSAFSRDYLKHGYSREPVSKGSAPLQAPWFKWRNSEFTFDQAEEFAHFLMQRSESVRRLSPWALAAYYPLVEDVNELATTPVQNIDWTRLHLRSRARIADYIAGKLGRPELAERTRLKSEAPAFFV